MPVDPWEWLSLIEREGPFLSKAALKSFYPSGLPRPDSSADDVNATFVDAFTRWSAAWGTSPDAYPEARDRWVHTVLHDLLDWSDDLQLAPGLEVESPNGAVRLSAWAALRSEAGPAALVTLVDRTEDLRAAGSDGWSANAIDRMAVLLRHTGVPVGIVTDGRWWALVSAAKDVTTASGVWDALLWREERASRDAFFALAHFASLAGGAPEKQLKHLFARSVTSAEEITEALGDQVRRAVELVLQSMSDTHLRALAQGEPSPLPENPRVVYEGAVTVLMRIVFLLFAEERGLLPEHQMYRASYAISNVREELQREATDTTLEALDHTWEMWHRLLAASNAVFGGATFQDMRMPAYGGSIFDPARFPWLYATDDQGLLRVRVTDRAMLAVLRAVQTIEDGAMQLSFRDLDVEQIGYVYEGLLGYSSEYVGDVTVGLQGKAGFEPEILLTELEDIAATAADATDFAKRLVEHLKNTQEHSKPRTANQIANAYSINDAKALADARTRLRHALLGDDELAVKLQPFHGLIRDDLRGFPYVVAAGGLVMTESPQRANTGTHYTPRSLAEEVVLHALEPLVYEPGPLDTQDSNEWKLKSSAEILDLKVADIAVGSGAFLVAAARYLADRLIEARAEEGLDVEGESDLKRWAIREVVARCLYGADINGMAVEMCKLSLWLISMDPGKPFSFVDDRVFHGNSLLGVATEAQLKAQHIYPERRGGQGQLLGLDVDKDLDDAARIRRELASGQVDDADRMRSTKAKQALLAQADRLTAKLRDVADGIIAAGLFEGGRPGAKLDDRYVVLSDALRAAYPDDASVEPDRAKLDAIIERGLTPTVDTGEARWKPLHWILAAPDVLHMRGGFDAIIGNPPFLAGKRVSIANGSNVEAWVKRDLPDVRGAADFSAHFIRRAWGLLRRGATIGMIATDRVAQGDSAEFSTKILAQSGTIYAAVPEFRWPGRASTGAVIVWATNRHDDLPELPRQLGDARVRKISAALRDADWADTTAAKPLEIPFLVGAGIGLYGDGFILEGNDALLGSITPAERALLRPFVNGQSLMSGKPSGRYAIDARQFESETELFESAPNFARYIFETVKPVRDAVTSQVHERRYWAFWDKRVNLFAEIEKLGRFIALAGDTRVPVFLFSQDARSVYSHKVVLLASDRAEVLGVLSSAAHTAWIETMRTGRGTTGNYVVSRVLRTFPFPENRPEELRAAAEAFIAVREVALAAYTSPTVVYNLLDDEACQSTEILNLREAQVSLDQVVIDAYGWGDLDLKHAFVMVAGVRRFGLADDVRDELRRRLFAENLRQAEATGVASRIGAKHMTGSNTLEATEKPEGAMF